MASFKRGYETATNAGVNNASVTDQSVTSNFVGFEDGKFRGAQVSIILRNEEADVTCDLLIKLFASRDKVPNVDTFPTTEFRIRPPIALETYSYTFDVADSLVGHGFKVELTSLGDVSVCDEYTVTLDVQVYDINDNS